MRIFIEVPTWLGDSVMTTPAIENIIKMYPHIRITLFGTHISTAIFEAHPNIENIILDKSKSSRLRWLWFFRMAKTLAQFDKAISFRSSFSSKVLLFFVKAEKKLLYKKNRTIERHQVLRYNDFINKVFNQHMDAEDLKISCNPMVYSKPTLGLNPGASYGSAKRWYPEKFAEVAIVLSKQFDIVIFGGPSEVDIANDIEIELQKNHVSNYINLAGKTDIKTLCRKIAGLNLFITGDSGPMHVAAAFKVPTVALFGPTKENETSPWYNPKSIIVKHTIDCAPCMKRICPLKHHECMKFITSMDVLNAVATITDKRYSDENII